ncbi:MAG: hypothetical protein HQ483_08435 [Rhodospirillales bacterium]|nr:hypothetical protein [Rhodospirillales bacterium]
MLDADQLKAEVAANRNHVFARQKQAPESIAKEDIAFIRKHGMSAYVEQVHKEKIAEMRAKILTAMGLSEDSLGQMPAGQRRIIEQMITDEIQKRLEANSVMNNKSTNDNGSYLKTMMMANGSNGFFTGPSLSAFVSFKDHFSHDSDNDPAFAFFRSKPEEK